MRRAWPGRGSRDWDSLAMSPRSSRRMPILPAPGQGALGIETRSDDHGDRAPLLASLEDPAARAATAAERAFLQALGGGCQVPVGALARSVADGSSIAPARRNGGRSERCAAAARVPHGSRGGRGADRGGTCGTSDERGSGRDSGRARGARERAGGRVMTARGGAAAKRTPRRRAGAAAAQGRAARETARDARDRGERNSSKREEQILDAAAKLFGGRDLSVVTMEEIATARGRGEGDPLQLLSLEGSPLFLHPGDADDRSSFASASGAPIEEVDARGRLKRFVAEDLSFLLERPDFFRMLRNEETRPVIERTKEVRELRHRLRDLVRSTLGQGMTQGTIRPVSSEWAADLILGTVEGAVLRCIEEGCKSARRAEESEALFDFLWRSLTCSDGSAEGVGRLSSGVGCSRDPGRRRRPGSSPERSSGSAERPFCCRFWRRSRRRIANPCGGRPGSCRTTTGSSSRAPAASRRCFSPGVRRDPLRSAGRPSSARSARRRRAPFWNGSAAWTSSPPRASGEGLARDLRTRGGEGNAFPARPGGAGRTELPGLLREAGGFVEDLAVYRTRRARGDLAGAIDRLRAFEREAVTFASPSAVYAFARVLGVRTAPAARGTREDGHDRRDDERRAPVARIRARRGGAGGEFRGTRRRGRGGAVGRACGRDQAHRRRRRGRRPQSRFRECGSAGR